MWFARMQHARHIGSGAAGLSELLVRAGHARSLRYTFARVNGLWLINKVSAIPGRPTHTACPEGD